MSSQRIVPTHAEIAVAVRTGDTANVIRLFNDKRAEPKSVLENGHSLIHVGLVVCWVSCLTPY